MRSKTGNNVLMIVTAWKLVGRRISSSNTGQRTDHQLAIAHVSVSLTFIRRANCAHNLTTQGAIACRDLLRLAHSCPDAASPYGFAGDVNPKRALVSICISVFWENADRFRFPSHTLVGQPFKTACVP